MAAMHHDESADLKVVGNKLKDILEVLRSTTQVKHHYSLKFSSLLSFI